MLKEVKIKNFAIIEKASIEFAPGFNVITGETGAGKSIIIDSVNAVLGERASADLIKSGCETAEVQAFFENVGKDVKEGLKKSGLDTADELIIKREINRNGKGRCYINDDLVTVNTLKNIAEYLADIHGQHEHQALLNIRNQLELLDVFGKLDGERAKYTALYLELRELAEKRASLVMSEQEKHRRLDLLTFTVKEIEDAKLKEGEDEKIASLRHLMVNSEKLAVTVNEIDGLISGGDADATAALPALETAVKKLEQLTQVDPGAIKTMDTLKTLVVELREVAAEVSVYREKLVFDPKELEEIDDRHDLLLKFKKKYGATVKDILEYYEKQKAELKTITQNEEEIEKLDAEIKMLRAEVSKKANALTEKRKKAAVELEKKVVKELADLGMAKTKFKVSFELDEDESGLVELKGRRFLAGKTGVDRAEFLISSNVGEEPKPLTKVASGGEMSRIMLSLKVIIGKEDKVGTLVFDEIDTGIGGNMGKVAGEKMAAAAKSRQVICITHLPQIAALAGYHLFIEKGVKAGKTLMNVMELKAENRVKEIARMLGGADNKAAVVHARELLK